MHRSDEQCAPNHIINSLYTDYFGSSVSYDSAPSEGATIYIVPAPATLLLLAAGLLPRRR